MQILSFSLQHTLINLGSLFSFSPFFQNGGHSHIHEGHSHEGHSHEGHSHEGHSHEGHSHGGHSHAPIPPDANYTEAQVHAVERVKKCEDYYEILGLTKQYATDALIKKAYHKMALQFHPDRNKAPGADAVFKAIANAYAVLSDPMKKKK